MCIRDRVSTQSTGTAVNTMAVHWLCARIDRWAGRHLLNTPSHDKVLHKRWLETIEAQNQHARTLWALFIGSLMFAIMGLVDIVLVLLLAVVIPLSQLTNTSQPRFERFGWINQLVQHCWFALRMHVANEQNINRILSGCDKGWVISEQSTRVFWGLLFISLWTEFSISRFSVLILNHMIANLTVLVFSGSNSLAPIISFLSMALFCYRRCWREAASDRVVAALAQEQLVRTKIEMTALQTTTENKSKFFRTLCHELRNPMTAIQGNCEMLVHTLSRYEGETPEDGRDLPAQVPKLTRFGRNALLSLGHMLEVLDDTLAQAKQEADGGTFMAQPTEFSVREMLCSVHLMFEVTAQQKGIDLQLVVPESVDQLRVLSTQNGVKLVIINLLSNALKFTHHGSVGTSVRVLNQTDSSAQLEFTLRDTGIGMTDEEVARLFSPFKQVLEKMGGSIDLQSVKGQGTEFKVVVPCRVKHPVQVSDEERAADLKHPVDFSHLAT
eukprot:TRINITY_DN10977_c0_g1_i1.p1 TRINITY_DN10977_c0_g1~~TRINITY_DN10977_c0_g1_i1.p1  ORF type:complete len:512 (-),score=127.96 TRINITY_DN10977_c0_g1_i1:402-1892(-)